MAKSTLLSFLIFIFSWPRLYHSVLISSPDNHVIWLFEVFKPIIGRDNSALQRDRNIKLYTLLYITAFLIGRIKYYKY